MRERNRTKNDISSWSWFFVALFCFLPLHVSAVALDEWFVLPPKPIGDGPDYEAIGYGLSKGHGWSTSFSDAEWRSVYENAGDAHAAIDYSVQLARYGPLVADTNRPPLMPFCIAMVYRIVPRGPVAFGVIRVALACCLSIGCAIAVAWAIAIAKSTSRESRSCIPIFVGLSLIAIVYSERNFRNYTTDFSTEPPAFLLTQLFLVASWYGSKNGAWRWAALSGALFATMVFCRGIFVLWIPLVLIWLWFAYRASQHVVVANRLEPRRWVTVFLLVFAMLTSIWWVRNCFVLGSFHPLGTKGAATLMGGYCDASFQAGGEWQLAPEREVRRDLESKMEGELTTPLDFRNLELEVNRQAGIQIERWVVDNSRLLPELFLKRIVTEWNPYVGKALMLRLLAVAGVLWLFRYHRVALIWLAGPLLINTLMVAVTYSVGGRFLVPTYGPFYILAAFGFSYTLNALICRVGGNRCFRAFRASKSDLSS